MRHGRARFRRPGRKYTADMGVRKRFKDSVEVNILKIACGPCSRGIVDFFLAHVLRVTALGKFMLAVCGGMKWTEHAQGGCCWEYLGRRVDSDEGKDVWQT